MREAYYEQVENINADLVEVTRLVSSAMNRATQALLDADLQLAEAVIDFDAKVDILTASIDERCFELIALQAPVATDLRVLLGAMRISSSLERMGDLAEHVAKQARMRHPKVAVPQEVRGIVLQAVTAKMGESSKDSQQLEESEENNPWAICTASVGREDKEKYEKCVKSVKKQNGGS